MEERKTICKNPWCKGTFTYFLNEESKIDTPEECPKCKSFATELSGGVEWKTNEYDGSRFDGLPHQIRYKVTNYRL